MRLKKNIYKSDMTFFFPTKKRKQKRNQNSDYKKLGFVPAFVASVL
jgi:hypothetical protein